MMLLREIHFALRPRQTKGLVFDTASNMLTVQKVHTYIEMSEFALTKIPVRYTTAVQAG